MAQESDKTIVTNLLGQTAIVEYGSDRYRGEIVAMWVDRAEGYEDLCYKIMLPGGLLLVVVGSKYVRVACRAWTNDKGGLAKEDHVCDAGANHPRDAHVMITMDPKTGFLPPRVPG